jgi:hypothetical protein
MPTTNIPSTSISIKVVNLIVCLIVGQVFTEKHIAENRDFRLKIGSLGTCITSKTLLDANNQYPLYKYQYQGCQFDFVLDFWPSIHREAYC